MPHATTDDGVKLYYEESGAGKPLIFVHEYAGDVRSWEPQMRFFSRYYRCIAFNARGFPPSDVPQDPEKYSQARARDDIRSVLDHLKVDKAHVCGLSMGGFAALHFGMTYGARALSLVVGGCGYGAEPAKREQFREETNAAAAAIERDGMVKVAERYSLGPTRVQFQNKDPRGWAEFAKQLAEHSTKGSALTMRGVQARRPSLWELVDGMKQLRVPTLILTGDEDDPCLEPALMMKRAIPTAGLAVMPNAGHTINIDEPDEFNRQVLAFLSAVEKGAWPTRDPRSLSGGTLSFGSYTSGQTVNLDVNGVINYVNCSGSLTFALDGGLSGNINARQMQQGAGRLNYQIYRNAVRNAVWGSGADAQGVVLVGTQSGSVTVYGRIPSGQVVPDGTYTDTVNVTLTF